MNVQGTLIAVRILNCCMHTHERDGRLVLRTRNGDPNSRGQPLRRGWLTSAYCVSQVCLFLQSPTRHQQTTKINRNRQSVSAASAPVQECQYEKTNSPFCAPHNVSSNHQQRRAARFLDDGGDLLTPACLAIHVLQQLEAAP